MDAQPPTGASSDAEGVARVYASPLRERQAQQTRELILDAVTQLIETGRIDEVTTKEIADTAGVSERTVYRHFPDRAALLSGLTARLNLVMQRRRGQPNTDSDVHRRESLDDFKTGAIELMADLEQFHVLARAEALFNADPRRFSPETRSNSRQFEQIITDGFPDLHPTECLYLTAVIRCFLSAQNWLRMREEFGIDGYQSGPLVAWAVQAVLDEVLRGNLPPTEQAQHATKS